MTGADSTCQTALHRLPRPHPVRRLVQGLGELILTIGLVALLFVAYQFWGRPAEIARDQHHLDAQLGASWQQDHTTTIPEIHEGSQTEQPAVQPIPGSTTYTGPEAGAGEVAEGQPFARLSVPKLGLRWTVVQGVSPASLRLAPGHYPNTGMPGEVGNFAVAGHRSAGIFFDLDEVVGGDAVEVETRGHLYVYRVFRTQIVNPHDVTVIAPNPERPHENAEKAVLTLTTCHPKWSNYQRLVVQAELVELRSKGSQASDGQGRR
jgi:sortase A